MALSRRLRRNIIAYRDSSIDRIAFTYSIGSIGKADVERLRRRFQGGIEHRRIGRRAIHHLKIRAPMREPIGIVLGFRLGRMFTIISRHIPIEEVLGNRLAVDYEFHNIAVLRILGGHLHVGRHDHITRLVPAGKRKAIPLGNFGRHRSERHTSRCNNVMILVDKDRHFFIPLIEVAPRVGSLSLVQFTCKFFHLHLGVRQGTVVQRRQSLSFAIADVVGRGPRSDTAFPGRCQVGPVRKGAERIQVFGIFIREVVVRNKAAGKRAAHCQAACDITEIGFRVGTGIFLHLDRADRIGVLHIESLVALSLGHEAAHKEAVATEIRIVDKDFARDRRKGNSF